MQSNGSASMYGKWLQGGLFVRGVIGLSLIRQGYQWGFEERYYNSNRSEYPHVRFLWQYKCACCM